MNHTITLTPKLNVTPTASPVAPRSLIGVLWHRTLRWLDKASPEAIWKAVRTCLMCLLIIALVCAPGFTIGYLTAVMQWNGYKIPICAGMIALMLNVKTIWTYCRRIKLKTRRGNQHTFHGFSISELADLLTQTNAFKKDDAQKRLAMTHTQWIKIAETLEKHGVLERGESNARVLRPITREELVKQLRDNFPLIWDEERKAWFERDGAMERWALNHEWKRRQISEDTERKERKLERVQKKIVEASAFQNILNMSVQ